MNKVSYLERTDGKLLLLEISESLKNRKSKRRNCSSVGRCDFHFPVMSHIITTKHDQLQYFKLILSGRVASVPLRLSEIISSKSRISSFSFVNRWNVRMERCMRGRGTSTDSSGIRPQSSHQSLPSSL